MSYFWKIKTKETLGHALYAHACSRFVYACFMHVYAKRDMHMHVRIPETMKGKFFCIKDGFWNESHIV